MCDSIRIIATVTDTITNKEYKADLDVINEGVLIIYGNGAELGDFGQFAESLRKEKLNEYPEGKIIVESIQNKNIFFQYLLNFNVFPIKELHIFSHASGGGLYLGYHNEESGRSRNAAYARAQARPENITYEEVVVAEVGAVLTDDFLTTMARNNKLTYISKFVKEGSFIKLWGCNAGISNWRYSDNPGQYYWSALNTKNTPKPSIAQAFADYFDVNTYGATSGSHIEFNVNGEWQILNRQPAKHNGIRLHPDRGDYELYTPG